MVCSVTPRECVFPAKWPFHRGLSTRISGQNCGFQGAAFSDFDGCLICGVKKGLRDTLTTHSQKRLVPQAYFQEYKSSNHKGGEEGEEGEVEDGEERR